MATEIKAALTIVHDNITIEYIEADNVFRFELRGRERKAESLTQAKEWIDKPAPVKKPTKKFERFQVVFSGGYMGYHKRSRSVVTVTSVAEDRYHHDKNNPSAAWVLKAGGERSKESVTHLYPIHPTNTARWGEYDRLISEKERIEKEAEHVLKSIQILDLKPYLLEEESVPARD